jgi:hypothetical protein
MNRHPVEASLVALDNQPQELNARADQFRNKNPIHLGHCNLAMLSNALSTMSPFRISGCAKR